MIELESIEKILKIVQLCEQYDEDINVKCNDMNLVIDGKSIAGMMGLINHAVSIEILSDDVKIKEKFKNELLIL